MKMLKQCIILAWFFSMVCQLAGQEKQVANLIIKTHVYKDGVAIRWTPSSLHLWRKWSKEGYRIERYTIARNGVELKNGESLLLGGGSIHPLKESEWDEYAKVVPDAGLVRYCIKGDSSVLKQDKESFFSNLEEENQCYIFSMLAMQSNFELAVAGGIGFVDRSVNSNEVYLYKLYPVGSLDKDTQLFVVDMQEVTLLPVITNFSASVKDNRVLLEWNARSYNKNYYGFRIERSTDSGKSYQALHDVPVIPVVSKEGLKERNEVYSDTIAQYHSRILYRICGVSYFGQNGPPSEPVDVIAYHETEEFPKFVEVEFAARDTSILSWKFEAGKENLVKGFRILVSDSAEGRFSEYDTTIIDRTQRSFKLHTDKQVCYIKVAAITLNGNYKVSFPVMVQQVDSTPPLPPVPLSLSVDTNGIVLLNWHPNTEKDWMGYLVFRGNDRHQEFSSITPVYLKDTFISDTLYNKMIRDSIFYKVIAVDNRYNESKYSAVTVSAIPNRIPPAPAYIYSIQKDNRHAYIQWHQSNSNDVAFYNLIKESSGVTEKIRIDKDSSGFTDSMVMPGRNYRYSIEAIDFTGLGSKIANPYEVRIPMQMIMPKVQLNLVLNDTVQNYLTFYWSYDLQDEVSHYRIVQVNEDGSSQTIGTTSSGLPFYNYYYLKPYTMKTYYIIAYFKDGRRSGI